MTGQRHQRRDPRGRPEPAQHLGQVCQDRGLRHLARQRGQLRVRRVTGQRRQTVDHGGDARLAVPAVLKLVEQRLQRGDDGAAHGPARILQLVDQFGDAGAAAERETIHLLQAAQLFRSAHTVSFDFPVVSPSVPRSASSVSLSPVIASACCTLAARIFATAATTPDTSEARDVDILDCWRTAATISRAFTRMSTIAFATCSLVAACSADTRAMLATLVFCLAAAPARLASASACSLPARDVCLAMRRTSSPALASPSSAFTCSLVARGTAPASFATCRAAASSWLSPRVCSASAFATWPASRLPLSRHVAF